MLKIGKGGKIKGKAGDSRSSKVDLNSPLVKSIVII